MMKERDRERNKEGRERGREGGRKEEQIGRKERRETERGKCISISWCSFLVTKGSP